MAPLPWAKKVTLLLAEPDIPYCDGENWLKLFTTPTTSYQSQELKLLHTVNAKSSCQELQHCPQTVALLHFLGPLKKALRSSSGSKDVSSSPFECFLYKRSYIDAPKKLGKKFDIILDDGRAR